jgi:hypothetical protein
MKQALVLLTILFVAVLAIAVAQRLSTEAAAMVVGTVCGVAASIPVSLGLLLVLGKLPGLRSNSQPATPTPWRDVPSVIVVTPSPAWPGWDGVASAGSRLPPGPEQFRVIDGSGSGRLDD